MSIKILKYLSFGIVSIGSIYSYNRIQYINQLLGNELIDESEKLFKE